MANIAKITANFGKNFEGAIADALAQEVKKRQDRIRRRIKTRVKSIVEFYIKTSPVVRSLGGGGGNPENSLQAELGLTDDAARRGINRLIKEIQDAVRVSVRAQRGTRASNSSEITVERLTSQEIEKGLDLNSDDFSYISRGRDPETKRRRSHKISWMALVLNPDEGLVDQYLSDVRNPKIFRGERSYWQIVRGNDQQELREKSGSSNTNLGKTRSRSGFAIMSMGGNFPYKLPSILLPKGKGKNFLDDVLRSRAFQSEIRKAIQDVIVEELRRQ